MRRECMSSVRMCQVYQSPIHIHACVEMCRGSVECAYASSVCVKCAYVCSMCVVCVECAYASRVCVECAYMSLIRVEECVQSCAYVRLECVESVWSVRMCQVYQSTTHIYMHGSMYVDSVCSRVPMCV